MSSWRKILMSFFLCLLVFGCKTGGNNAYNSSNERSGSAYYDEALVRKVYFDYNKSAIKEESKSTLLELVKMMQEHPDKNLLIVGHTDERGTEEYNIALGERRANAARAFMVSCDSDLKSRIMVDSKGKSEPEVIGHGEAVWSKNRRTVLHLLSATEMDQHHHTMIKEEEDAR